jgi:hypothetical protein
MTDPMLFVAAVIIILALGWASRHDDHLWRNGDD